MTNPTAAETAGPFQPVSLRAELDPRGIDTGNRRRDSDLRGARFLAAGRWPAITYQASAGQASGAGWTIDGTFAVKDSHCPVRLNVSGPDVPDDPAAPVNLCATPANEGRI
jgi:polyisoprenoid-binding protein YceI